MASDSFIITGEVNVQITVTENSDGTLQFQIDVLDETGSIGDLNALYFDLSDDSRTSSLSVLGDDITGSVFKTDGVTKVDNYTNMNGEVLKELGKFDGGVQFGTSGIGTDDIRSTTFTLASSDGPLTLADFSLQDFGVRLTSVGAEDGSRDGSLKLGGTAPDFDDCVPVTFDPDYMTVDETKTFFPNADLGQTDILDNDSFQLISNDPGANAVISVTNDLGQTFAVGDIVTNSDGTQIVVYPDGTFSFSAQNAMFEGVYDDLNDFEQATTTFTYETDNCGTGSLVITINGLTDPGGPDGPGGPDSLFNVDNPDVFL